MASQPPPDNEADNNTNTGGASLRTELVGHVSVLLMSLLGIAIYSATYSVFMSVGLSAKVVPLLEFWVIFTQLGCTLVCILTQFIVAGVFKINTGVAGISVVQVALFLGLACACTVLSSQCLAGDRASCRLFFPAAAYAQAAAVGIIVWSWTMYMASLGCLRVNVGSISLGIDGAGGITAACVMLLFPARTESAVISICGRTALPERMCIGLGNNCGSVSISIMVWLCMAVTVTSVYLRKCETLQVYGVCIQFVCSIVLCLSAVFLVDSSVVSLNYRLVASGLAFCSLLDSILFLLSKLSSARPVNANNGKNDIVAAKNTKNK